MDTMTLNPPTTSPSAPTRLPHSCLSFRLGEEEYGIDLVKVQEIRTFSEPTRLAGTPHYVRGIIDLRGTIVPILDLRRKFGLPHQADREDTILIVLRVLHRVVGIVVDAVNEVVDIAPGQLRAAPTFNALVDADYILGMMPLPQPTDSDGEAPERLLIVTDIERLMGSPEMGLVR